MLPLIATVGFAVAQTDEPCPLTPNCCDEDCCAAGTSFVDGRCVTDPTSSGFTGIFSAGYVMGCAERKCCEANCCLGVEGVAYDAATNFCTPVGCDCALPSYLADFALITEGDASLGPKNIYKGIAIGGTLTDVDPNLNNAVSTNFGNTQSYIFNNGTLNFSFNGQGATYGATLADAGINFEALRCLARKATSSESGQFKVVVMETGGSFDTFDFRNGGQGEDNGNTLVIFNTDQDVTLQSVAGRQFGPSVLAPFSKVIIPGDIGFVDGFVVAKTFESVGSASTSVQLHGDTYNGPITCA